MAVENFATSVRTF